MLFCMCVSFQLSKSIHTLLTLPEGEKQVNKSECNLLLFGSAGTAICLSRSSSSSSHCFLSRSASQRNEKTACVKTVFSHGPRSPANRYHTKYFHMCSYSSPSFPLIHPSCVSNLKYGSVWNIWVHVLLNQITVWMSVESFVTFNVILLETLKAKCCARL